MTSILIIDDDVTLLTRLGAQLETAGYEVLKSSAVGHGEQLYAEHRPDAVILEVRSDDDKGWELLGRLAAETTVFVLSGAAREEDVVRALEEGAADHLPKPYRTGELLARLRLRLGALVTATEPVSNAVGASALTRLPTTPPPTPAISAPPPAPTSTRKKRRADQVDASVFMSEAEEMALLRTPSESAPAKANPPPASEILENVSFGQRMRTERQRRHLSLVQIENDLKIRMTYLQAMEDEKFTLLPRGPAALDMVRTYAEHLGLDAGTTLEEFRTQHSIEAAAPPLALGGTPLPRTLPRWIVILAAVLLALAVGLGTIIVFDPGFFTRLPAFFQSLWVQVMGYL